MLSGFKAFLFRGNVIDLAVAVVVGAAFNTVVQAFVKDLLTPLIAAVGGKPDFSALTFTVNNSKFLYGELLPATQIDNPLYIQNEDSRTANLHFDRYCREHIWSGLREQIVRQDDSGLTFRLNRRK